MPQARLAAGQPWNGRLLNRRQDGSVYLAEVSITPVHAPDGSVSHYLGMHRDVTDMHRLECQVRNQKALIESVVDAAPMLIALLDVDDRVVLDNQEYKKLVADLRVKEPAHTLLDSVLANWRDELAARPERCIFFNREARVDRPGGRPRWLSVSATTLATQSDLADAYFSVGGQTGLLLVISDVSSVREEQERARTASLQAVLAEEERTASLREGLSAAIFRLEEPMNVMASAVSMLQRRDPSAAAMLKQALTASRPFRGESVGATLLQVVRSVPEPLRALRPDIPAHIEAAVMRALSRDRLARYPSLPAFIEALQGDDPPPAGLPELTDVWLRPSARADAARQRALTISGAAPSFQSVALGLGSGGGGGVPEIVEDSATVPNTMEEVMRLAVPPERIEVLESTAPVVTDSEAKPGVPRVRPLPGVANQAARALAAAGRTPVSGGVSATGSAADASVCGA